MKSFLLKMLLVAIVCVHGRFRPWLLRITRRKVWSFGKATNIVGTIPVGTAPAVPLRLRQESPTRLGRPEGLGGGSRSAAKQRRMVRTAATGTTCERPEHRNRALCGAAARWRSRRISHRGAIAALNGGRQ